MLSMNNCCKFLCPVLLALFIMKMPGFFVMLFPQPLNSWIFRALYYKEKVNDPNYWTEKPMFSYTEATKMIANRTEVFHSKGYPVVIRNFIDPPAIEHAMEVLKKANGKKELRVIEYAEDYKDHISVNCGSFSGFDLTKYWGFDEFAAGLESGRNIYGGFEGLTDPEAVSSLLGFDITTLSPLYLMNQMFVSNLNRNLMTAGLHCAPSDALAVQLVGKKTWLFSSPQQLTKTPYINMKGFFPIGYTDDELLDAIGDHRVVEVGPGDAVYFGPCWCHAVVTSAGYNLMFNMRYNSAADTFRTMTVGEMVQVFINLISINWGGHPQEQHEKFGNLYTDVLNMYECGESNRVKEMVEFFGARMDDPTKFGKGF